MKYIVICLYSKDPDFILLLNWLVVYLMPTAMKRELCLSISWYSLVSLASISEMNQSQSRIQHHHSSVVVNCPSDVSQNYQSLCIISKTDQPHDQLNVHMVAYNNSYLSLVVQLKWIQDEQGLKYPCGQCNHAVKNSENLIACDSCSKWYHKDCLSLGDQVFDCYAKNENLEWICTNRALNNISNSVFDSLISPNASDVPPENIQRKKSKIPAHISD